MEYAVLGLITAVSTWSVARFVYLWSLGVATTGTLVALARHVSNDGDASYQLVVAFTTTNGVRVEAEGGTVPHGLARISAWARK